MRRRLALVLAAAATVLVAACSENLNTPSECPELCPGEQVPVQSMVIEPALDTVYPLDPAEGYQDRRFAQSIRVTTLGAADDPIVGTTDLGLVSFVPRPDSVTVRDTLRPVIGVDSVAIAFTVQGRDTTARGLALLVYRAPDPSTVDTGASFATLEAMLQPANAVDTIPVHDTLETGAVRSVLVGDDMARLGLDGVGADSLALVVAAAADRPTGVRLSSRLATAEAPRVVSYVRVQVGDTVLAQVVTQTVAFNTFVSRTLPTVDPAFVMIGGAPATRGFLDFDLPPVVRDSARIVRATLELTPVAPLTGLRGDPAGIEARVPVIDLGPKSPLYPRSRVRPGLVVVDAAVDTTFGIEVTTLVRIWQADSTRPSAFVVSVAPEGATFTRGTFFSSAAADPAVRPRLRIDYVLPFDFEAP